MADGKRIFTRAEIVNGTGWSRDARFKLVQDSRPASKRDDHAVLSIVNRIARMTRSDEYTPSDPHDAKDTLDSLIHIAREALGLCLNPPVCDWCGAMGPFSGRGRRGRRRGSALCEDCRQRVERQRVDIKEALGRLEQAQRS